MHRKMWRRALALIACAALVYLAAGGTLVHKHQNGPETACHVCQAIHMPALAAVAQNATAMPSLIGWYTSLPLSAAPVDALALHFASRAPPAA